MTERDPLRERFEAFREQSLRGVRPPGVESMPGIVRARRRRATWMAVGAVAAAAVLALLVPPWWRDGRIEPVPQTSPTPAPSTDSASPAPRPGGSSASPGASHSAPPHSSAPANPVSCTTPPNVVRRDSTRTGYSTVSVEPSDFFQHCPDYQLRFVRAVYRWSAEQQQIALASSTDYVLTKAAPSVDIYNPTPNPQCGIGVGYVTLQDAGPVPATIPSSVRSGGASAFLAYIQQAGRVVEYRWQFSTDGAGPLPACEKVSSGPSNFGTPSP